MPTARARLLCPKLIVVPPDFEKYELFSRRLFSYAHDFTPLVEVGSIDEGYLDLSGCRGRSPGDIGRMIGRAVQQSLKITISEGIGQNKLVSQIASKVSKPSGFVEIFAQAYRRWGLATVRWPVVEVEGRVTPFDNGNGFALDVYRVGKPRLPRGGGSPDSQPCRRYAD